MTKSASKKRAIALLQEGAAREATPHSTGPAPRPLVTGIRRPLRTIADELRVYETLKPHTKEGWADLGRLYIQWFETVEKIILDVMLQAHPPEALRTQFSPPRLLSATRPFIMELVNGVPATPWTEQLKGQEVVSILRRSHKFRCQFKGVFNGLIQDHPHIKGSLIACPFGKMLDLVQPLMESRPQVLNAVDPPGVQKAVAAGDSLQMWKNILLGSNKSPGQPDQVKAQDSQPESSNTVEPTALVSDTQEQIHEIADLIDFGPELAALDKAQGILIDIDASIGDNSGPAVSLTVPDSVKTTADLKGYLMSEDLMSELGSLSLQ